MQPFAHLVRSTCKEILNDNLTPRLPKPKACAQPTTRAAMPFSVSHCLTTMTPGPFGTQNNTFNCSLHVLPLITIIERAIPQKQTLMKGFPVFAVMLFKEWLKHINYRSETVQR